MVLRIRPLDGVDPRAVPLPHGTEVVTRIDRVLPDRVVPEGSIGRKVPLEPDATGRWGIECCLSLG